jgi:hypothetical protein
VIVERVPKHTEDLVADIVFPDEVAQELLVDTGLVDNLRGRSVPADTEEKDPI